MKQSRTASLIETTCNTLAGFGLSLLAQAICLPLLGVEVTLVQNFAFAVIMTSVSIGRGYVLRRIFEALHIRRPLSPAMHAVIAERWRQVEAEGWTAEHDDGYAQGELARAGAIYAYHSKNRWQHTYSPNGWPWSREWFKPQDFRRDNVRAAALIIAEIERHDRNRRTIRGAADSFERQHGPLAHGKTRREHAGTSE